MTTETWPDLNTYDTVGLLAHLDYLRKQRTYKEAASLKIEARAYELRIAAAERMLAIHNRRATEAEDQRVAEERTLAATLRGLRNALLGWRDDVEAACLDWGHTITDRIDAMLKLAPATEERPTLTEERVREVVGKLALDEIESYPVHRDHRKPLAWDIAARAAKELAGAVVDQSQRDAEFAALREALHCRLQQVNDLHPVVVAAEAWRDGLKGLGSHVEQDLEAAVDFYRARGRRTVIEPAQHEADLREAFCAGFAFAEDKADISEHDGWHKHEPRIEWPKTEQREQAAAEYARSKAGG